MRIELVREAERVSLADIELMRKHGPEVIAPRCVLCFWRGRGAEWVVYPVVGMKPDELESYFAAFVREILQRVRSRFSAKISGYSFHAPVCSVSDEAAGSSTRNSIYT